MPRKIAPTTIRRKRKLGHDAAVIWILHRTQPRTLEELTNEAATLTGAKITAMSASLRYDNLPYLIDRGIVRKLSEDLYVLADFDDQQLTVQRCLEDFELLRHRWPEFEEISADLSANLGVAPDQAKSIFFKFASRLSWKLPGVQDKATAPQKARMRLELAAWIKLGGHQTNYVTENYAQEDFDKAKMILNKHPQYVPTIHAFRVKGDSSEVFRCTFEWPQIATKVADTSQDPFISRTIRVESVKECIQPLKIDETP